MNTFVIERWYDEGRACTFYTVRRGMAESETDSFFDTYAAAGHSLEEKPCSFFVL